MKNKTFEDRENNLKTLLKTIHIKEWNKELNDDQTMKEQKGKVWKYVASVTWYGDWACGGNTKEEAKDNLANRILKYRKQDFNAFYISTPISKPA